MSRHIKAPKFKAKCLALMDEVARTGLVCVNSMEREDCQWRGKKEVGSPIDLRQCGGEDGRNCHRMIPFLYRCPTTGLRVQALTADDETDEYEAITCLACGGMHLVNPKTGKVIDPDQP